MQIDSFNLILALAIFLIYAAAFVLSAVLTFSLGLYRKIEDRLNLDIINSRVITPLERNVNSFNDWMLKNNKIIGPVLILLSIVDIKLSFNVLRNL
ncbi:MAG: hypothetical protein Q8N85_01540 [Candidatus Omnitrophota bacterium]|nr:hypothetical protein [Candidatus Omnitrophota bacterium]